MSIIFYGERRFNTGFIQYYQVKCSINNNGIKFSEAS